MLNLRAAGQQHPGEGDVFVLVHVAEVILDRQPVLTRPFEGVIRLLLSNEDARVTRPSQDGEWRVRTVLWHCKVRTFRAQRNGCGTR